MTEEAEDFFTSLPPFPSPTGEEMKRFNREDWAEHFFEWHRTIGLLALTVSFIQPDSPAIRRIDRLKYIILTALLNRCAQLMMANLCLGSDGKHNEVMALIGRSLHETTIKLSWLCISKRPDRFRRFLADGLKSDLEFKDHILRAIKGRGHKIEIERRMLKSIQNSIKTAKMTAKSVQSTKKLPSLASMMEELGMSDLSYTIIQRMGSHFVHGTWSGLLSQCLEPDEKGNPRLKGDFSRPHPNTFMLGGLMVVDAIDVLLSFLTKARDRKAMLAAITTYGKELRRHNLIMATEDMTQV